MMKRLHLISWLRVGLLCGVLPALVATARAQEGAPPLVVPLPQGGFAAFKIKTAPLTAGAESSAGAPELRLPFSARAFVGAGNVVHRLLVADDGAIVFGYDLVVESLDAGKKFKVTARPLDAQFATQARREVAGPTVNAQPAAALGTLVRAAAEQTISDGETFALDLLVNERAGLRVTDHVRVAIDKSRLLLPSAPFAPRDFTVTSVELAVKNSQLRVDGQAVYPMGARRSCAGALLWLALPGRGRFVFSLAPHEGYDFRKTAVVDENKIVFTWNGTRYEWVSEAPIVGSGGAWNLWVLRDPDFDDSFTRPENEAAGEPSLEDALRDPLGALSARVREQRRGGGLRTEDSEKRRRPQPPARPRVRVGAANSIEALLPKR